MTIFDAMLLGAVQGLTAFFPVSSTGHLILARTVFHITDMSDLGFGAMIQLAAAAAVIVYFSSDVWQLIQTALRKLGRLPVNKRDEIFLYALLLGTVPALVLGVMLDSVLESLFSSPILIAVILIAGSILFMYAEWIYQNTQRVNEMTTRKGINIGVFQLCALVPGMSRLGATMSGGMMLGLTRTEATRFAFLLAIPVITGIGLRKFIEMIASTDSVAWVPVIVGATMSFAVGLATIHFMMRFMRTHTVWPFIWYRIILASFVIFITVFG